MENASKALIIAGAILLAILIIGLGMLIFNQAKDTVGQANLDQETITAFNSKFDAYIGNSIKGTNVKALLKMIRDNNLNINQTTIYPIFVNAEAAGVLGGNVTTATLSQINNGNANDADEAWGRESAPNLNAVINRVSGGATYIVNVTYSEATRLINRFNITANTTTTTP